MDFDINLLRNAITLAAFASFLAIVGWAYSPSRRAKFQEQGESILEKSDQ